MAFLSECFFADIEFLYIWICVNKNNYISYHGLLLIFSSAQKTWTANDDLCPATIGEGESDARIIDAYLYPVQNDGAGIYF
jgi:hypothetical protein